MYETNFNIIKQIDRDPNCEFVASVNSRAKVKATREILQFEEILLNYVEDFFGEKKLRL